MENEGVLPSCAQPPPGCPRGSAGPEPQPSLPLLPGLRGGGAARGGPCSSLWLWRALTLVLLAAVLALALALKGAVTETETTVATVMAGKCRPCPEDWMWYRNHCYYFSKEMQNWNSSRKFCWSYNATLAVIKEKSALDTIYSNKGKEYYWIGLRKETEGWRWVDGSPFTNDIITLEEGGQHMSCAYLNIAALVPIDCMSWRRWICVKMST